jgi:hypothetical protein
MTAVYERDAGVALATDQAHVVPNQQGVPTTEPPLRRTIQ